MSHGYDGLSSYGWKQGKWRQNWTRRYLVLRGDEILYYKSPQDAHARGTIALTSLLKVQSSINPEEDGFPKDLYFLVLETPVRNWKLGFEKPDDLASWLQMCVCGTWATYSLLPPVPPSLSFLPPSLKRNPVHAALPIT